MKGEKGGKPVVRSCNRAEVFLSSCVPGEEKMSRQCNAGTERKRNKGRNKKERK